MRKKLLVWMLGVCLLLPGYTFANGISTEENCKEKNTADCNDKTRHHLNYQDWQKRMKQKQQLLFTFVEKYTPEKKKEWEEVINERNGIMEKWASPQMAEKRNKWEKEKMAKFEELHKQYKEGKISKEEFLNKIHGGSTNQWGIYHELKDSVKNQDDKKTVQLLNQLLVSYKQKNEMMKAALKK